jgi:hypothetical protein
MTMRATLFCLLPAWGFGCSADGTGGPTDGATTPPGCRSNDDCDPGELCYGNACLAPCGGGACDPGFYCFGTGSGGYCAPGVVATCPATRCNADQVCASGLCSAPPPTSFCGTNPFATDDGCGTDAICLPGIEVDGTVDADRRCYALPPCPENGDCPTGTHGALCNDGYFADKARFCMPGLCLTAAADCPSGWHCIMRNSAPLIGYCSDGSVGSLCRDVGDCNAGLACQALGTAIGTCN